ncbi:hypothetical protein F4803DRAFT_532553 [Xylaria telfairii]|nr:hypothetical protein F4803DRAFT_532553 [Xylaria telfairii]
MVHGVASTVAKKDTRLATARSRRRSSAATATRKVTPLEIAPSPRICPRFNVATVTNMATAVENVPSPANDITDSRVQCQNCGEMGHTKVRCKKETVAPDTFDGGNDGVATGGGFGEGAGDPASSDWMKEAATNAGSRVNNEWDAPVTGGQSAW